MRRTYLCVGRHRRTDDSGTHTLTVLVNRPDIAVDGEYSCVSARDSAFVCIVVLVNRGGGRLQPFRYVDRLVDHYDTPRSLAIGDLNRDGMADLVTVGEAGDKETSVRISVSLRVPNRLAWSRTRVGRR